MSRAKKTPLQSSDPIVYRHQLRGDSRRNVVVGSAQGEDSLDISSDSHMSSGPRLSSLHRAETQPRGESEALTLCLNT